MNTVYLDKNSDEMIQIDGKEIDQSFEMLIGREVDKNGGYGGVSLLLTDRELVEIRVFAEGVEEMIGAYPIEILRKFLNVGTYDSR